MPVSVGLLLCFRKYILKATQLDSELNGGREQNSGFFVWVFLCCFFFKGATIASRYSYTYTCTVPGITAQMHAILKNTHSMFSECT